MSEHNRPVLIEVIVSHICTGCQERIPEIAHSFAAETGANLEYRFYRAWEIGEQESLPDHDWNKLQEIRQGKEANSGFFVNGRWLCRTTRASIGSTGAAGSRGCRGSASSEP